MSVLLNKLWHESRPQGITSRHRVRAGENWKSGDEYHVSRRDILTHPTPVNRPIQKIPLKVSVGNPRKACVRNGRFSLYKFHLISVYQFGKMQPS